MPRLTEQERAAIIESLTGKTLLSAAQQLAEMVKAGLMSEAVATAILDTYPGFSGGDK